MRCITIINYTCKDKPIFTVASLSDRAFAHGFRTLNPEFSATSTAIQAGEEALRDYLNILDHEVEDLFTSRVQTTPKHIRFYNERDYHNR